MQHPVCILQQAPETEEEMKILKERLKQNEVHLQVIHVMIAFVLENMIVQNY